MYAIYKKYQYYAFSISIVLHILFCVCILFINNEKQNVIIVPLSVFTEKSYDGINIKISQKKPSPKKISHKKRENTFSTKNITPDTIVAQQQNSFIADSVIDSTITVDSTVLSIFSNAKNYNDSLMVLLEHYPQFRTAITKEIFARNLSLKSDTLQQYATRNVLSAQKLANEQIQKENKLKPNQNKYPIQVPINDLIEFISKIFK